MQFGLQWLPNPLAPCWCLAWSSAAGWCCWPSAASSASSGYNFLAERRSHPIAPGVPSDRPAYYSESYPPESKEKVLITVGKTTAAIWHTNRTWMDTSRRFQLNLYGGWVVDLRGRKWWLPQKVKIVNFTQVRGERCRWQPARVERIWILNAVWMLSLWLAKQNWQWASLHNRLKLVQRQPCSPSKRQTSGILRMLFLTSVVMMWEMSVRQSEKVLHLISQSEN